MEFSLPKIGKEAIPMPHFPTIHQAFIFRAYEYVSPERIAKILKTDVENVRQCAKEMGLCECEDEKVWLEKGYITIIRAMWHILPYDQLLELLEMDEGTFSVILREEDFLDVKLKEKPDCAPVRWRELTEEEKAKTAQIKKAMETISFEGVKPFEFNYNVPELKFSGKEYFKSRYIYLFTGLYLHAFDVDSRVYCPDELLESYKKLGINGLWTQAVLYQLTEFPFEPSVSKGYEKRLANLKDFVARCKKYGIKLFLYLNEPRSMPDEFYKKYPQFAGHTHDTGRLCLCTSAKEVRDYLTNNIEWLCRQVPDIGGFFTITRSENPTNCYSHSTPETCTCPRCKNRSVGEVIGEVISCFEEGAHRVSPDIQVIAWDWAWSKKNNSTEEIIDNLPDNVTMLCKSEEGVEFTFGGVTNTVRDYSITKVGPGKIAKTNWQQAKKRGLSLGAKVQVTTSWECSTVPAVPVYPIIEKHIKALRNEGVDTLMLSWTLGGYPSLCLAHAAKYFYENCEMPELSDNVKKACDIISEALYEFPSSLHVEYYGPHNAGPSTLLYDKPTGYEATMTCFAYDDLIKWRDNYPEDVYEEQFTKICSGLEKALLLLENEPENETVIMAKATYYTYKASLNQIQFIRARDKGDIAVMLEKAKSEIEIARSMLELMNKDASIGFEAANHYYYSKGQLAEKILNCEDIIKRYK